MTRRTPAFLAPLTLALVVGCSSSEGPVDNAPVVDKPAAGAPAAAPAPATAAEGAKATLVTLSADQIKEINSLPDEADRKVALEQKVCPVGDGPLGEMGTPIKVTSGGKTAFLCCGGCKKSFEADPAKYLAKLGAK